MRPKLELLEPELVNRVLGEAYELLMNPGVKVQSSEAREFWRRPERRWRAKSRISPKR